VANILVIGPEAELRRSLTRLLESLGHTVAESAEQGAWREYERMIPDLVLADLRRAGEPGIQAMVEICAADPSARVLNVSEFLPPHWSPAKAAAFVEAARSVPHSRIRAEILTAVYRVLGDAA